MDLSKLGLIIEELHDRLSGVIVERLHWSAFLARYDTPETLFHLDPPYFGSEGDYGAGLFSRTKFADMAEQLGRLEGSFILSLNDHPEVRRIFERFHIEGVGTHYGLASRGSQPAGEVIIT